MRITSKLYQWQGPWKGFVSTTKSKISHSQRRALDLPGGSEGEMGGSRLYILGWGLTAGTHLSPVIPTPSP